VMRRAACPVSIDPGSAEFLRELGPANFVNWTAGAAMLFPNSEEAAVLAGTNDVEAQGERLAALYPLVVIKRGAAGCEAFRGAERWRLPAPAADVVDTTGAGDAFAAAFLAARLSGEATEESLRRAVAAGSAATEFVGGRPL
jgi:sugar/nucleoside kinase (ribokinase family)